MASPQKENGFTAIANEIIEQLVKTCLLGSEYQVLLFILRKTYGYHKKQDQISLTQFENGTGLSRPTIVKTLKNLMNRNMIVKIYLPDQNVGYSFVKDHEKWVVNTHLLVKGKWSTSKDVLTETSKDVLTHKRKKDNTKDNSKTSVLQGKEWNNLIDAFKEVNPLYEGFYKNTTERKALEFIASKIGYEKLLATIQHLPEITSKKYAPKITKPTELKRDLGKLITFYKQIENKKIVL